MRNNDEAKLSVLLGELASDSMRKKETPQQWAERLLALREALDVHIAAARESS